MYIMRLDEMQLAKRFMHRYPDDEVKSAVWDYVSGYTTEVNTKLREGHVRAAGVVTKVLDKAFTDTLPKLNVYRTVDWNFMKNMYGITQENLREHIGSIIQDNGYMSTASVMASPWAGYWFDEELILHIVSRKPVKVVDVNKLLPPEDIDCEEQNEIILPRGSMLKIVGYEIKKGRKHPKCGTYFIETEYL